MPVMAVNSENPQEQTGDYRSRPRWSAGNKLEAVLRLLRGEPLETLSRELRNCRQGCRWGDVVHDDPPPEAKQADQ
jgi:hypothetical protein